MSYKTTTIKVILIINYCFLLGYLVVSCAGPKKLKEPTPVLKKESIPIDPTKSFDASAMRMYKMASLYPNILQKKMLSSRLDSLQINLIFQTKPGNGSFQFQKDSFQLMRNSMVEMGMMGKLVLALACAKKMETYKAKGVSYSSTMITESAGKNLPGSYNDPYAMQGRPSIGHFLARMLTQNDVEAYNRILEFVTIKEVNEFSKANGWDATKITSRIGRTNTSAENASMNTINFYDDNNRKIFIQPNSHNSQSSLSTRYANTTSLDDMESIILSVSTSQFRNKELTQRIGEDPLEHLKLLLFNPQSVLPYNASAETYDNGSMLFPNVKLSDQLMLLSLKMTSDKGMSEIVYYNDLKKGKVFVLSCSILFKISLKDPRYENELKEGKQIFEELGKATLKQLQN